MEPQSDGPRLPSRVVAVAEPVSEPAPTVQRPITAPVPVVQEPEPPRRHHTLVPRSMCIAGQLMWLAIPALVLKLAADGRVEWTDSGFPQLDQRGRELIALLTIISVAANLMGWLWWSTVAALNARHVSRHTLWPGTPLAALVVQLAAAGVVRMVQIEDDVLDTGVSIAVWSVVIIAHFAVLGSFRRAAAAIHAPQAPWTRLIVLPWAAAAFNGIGAFFIGFISQEMAMLVIGLQYGVLLWYVLSFSQAMTSFDRGCIGRVSIGQDDQVFAKFLKHRG